MQLVATVNKAKLDVFRWRCELTIPRKILLALGVAAMVGLLAQVRVILPWSPVPITGQTFAVLLAAILMGRWWGGISMAMYVALGAAGIPWFNGLTSGLGATAGYMAGFILAALFLGYFSDRYIRARGFTSMLGLMLTASLVIIYVPGLIWLSFWLNSTGISWNMASLLAMGLTPFIVGDITKSVLAAMAARALTPKQSFNNEVDQER